MRPSEGRERTNSTRDTSPVRYSGTTRRPHRNHRVPKTPGLSWTPRSPLLSSSGPPSHPLSPPLSPCSAFPFLSLPFPLPPSLFSLPYFPHRLLLSSSPMCPLSVSSVSSDHSDGCRVGCRTTVGEGRCEKKGGLLFHSSVSEGCDFRRSGAGTGVRRLVAFQQ